MSEKKSINLTITDINDIHLVLEALTKLFKSIVYHYSITDQLDKVETLLLSTKEYAEKLLTVMYGEEENNEGEEWKH